MGLILNVNGTRHSVDVEPETPLLWVLRDTIGLTGTKFACGIAHCGACTVHVDGKPTRSCSFSVNAAVGTEITTIEGSHGRTSTFPSAAIANPGKSCRRWHSCGSDQIQRTMRSTQR